MRTRVRGRRAARMAAMAASVALLVTACGTKSPSTVDGQPSGTPSTAAPALTAGALLISDGTDTVTIGGRAVTFPSTVTDATWSPDGSRIAYVDGDGNVATAKPDGTGVLVLTATDKTVVRSRPSWSRDVVFYAEKKGTTSTLMSVPVNGCGPTGSTVGGTPWDMDTGPGTSYVDLAPSAAFSYSPASVSFQHNEPSGPQIWINDTNQRAPYTYKVVNGSEPALSPDGKRLAYLGTDGQIFLTTVAANGGAGVQITFGANHPTRPVWSPDGLHIAYETPTDIESVGLSPGANANPAAILSSRPGVPAFLSATRNAVARISGPDPIALSIAVSQARWATEEAFSPYQSYPGAFAATITTPGLALGATLAGGSGGPLLLTDGTSLDPRTKAELQRIFGTVDAHGPQPQVTIVGNPVSSAVDHALEAMGYAVVRGPGKAIDDTPAGDCGPQLNASLYVQSVIVVDSSSTTDDAAATTMAASWHAPILRLKGGTLDDAAKAYLARSAPGLESVYIVDSTGAISNSVQKQIGDLIGGPAGYDTRSNPAYAAP